MKTNELYILREIAGDYLLIPVGEASQQLNGMIHLTETAQYIWKQVDTARDLEEIVRNLQEEFEVDAETARRDVYGFLTELYRREMVLDVPELKDVEILPADTK